MQRAANLRATLRLNFLLRTKRRVLVEIQLFGWAISEDNFINIALSLASRRRSPMLSSRSHANQISLKIINNSLLLSIVELCVTLFFTEAVANFVSLVFDYEPQISR